MKKDINDLLLKMLRGESCIGETANALVNLKNFVRTISVYSNAEDERLDYRKKYVFHHFVGKRKALIENKESGELLEVHYENFKFD
tara:strand:+ start:610 stop:867 length:258 start_codon:yes stop_codon:yes gene_type:complete